MKKKIVLLMLAIACLGSLGSSGESCCPAGDPAMMPAPLPAGQEPVAGERWELEIVYHEQVAYEKKDIQEGKYSTVTAVERIEGALDYRITATLGPAAQQPGDAARPDQGLRYYIAEGVQAQIKDDFVHTSTDTTSARNAKIEEMKKWEWHADTQGPIPLNIRLMTAAAQNSYHLTLTHQGPMDLDDREPRPGFAIPWNYAAKHILNGRAQLDCAGTMEVGSPDNYPGKVFTNLPKALFAYDGSQKELRGEHTWTGKSSELNVVDAETPGCKKSKALSESGKVYPSKSVKKTLTWTLRRLEQ